MVPAIFHARRISEFGAFIFGWLRTRRRKLASLMAAAAVLFLGVSYGNLSGLQQLLSHAFGPPDPNVSTTFDAASVEIVDRVNALPLENRAEIRRFGDACYARGRRPACRHPLRPLCS